MQMRVRLTAHGRRVCATVDVQRSWCATGDVCLASGFKKVRLAMFTYQPGQVVRIPQTVSRRLFVQRRRVVVLW